MTKSKLRGHDIYYTRGKWLYCDTNQPTINNGRDCGFCRKANRADDIDPCLGKLPGVMNACCGHGNQNESYVQFVNGLIIRNFNIEENY